MVLSHTKVLRNSPAKHYDSVPTTPLALVPPVPGLEGEEGERDCADEKYLMITVTGMK